MRIRHLIIQTLQRPSLAVGLPRKYHFSTAGRAVARPSGRAGDRGNRGSLAAVLTIGLCLSGCLSVGPDYKAPSPPEADYSDVVTSASKTAADRRTAEERQADLTSETLANWWKTFNDPTLTQLIDEAVQGNSDMKEAQARVREIQSRLTMSRAGFFPSVDANGKYARARTSENTAAGEAANAAGTDLNSNFYRGGFDAAWEIDVFGGTRRAVEAAKADLESAEASLDSVWISLAGEIGQTYIQTRTYQRRIQVAEDNLRVQQETYDILESRFKAGLSDDLAVQQARYNLERTRATIPSLRVGLESVMNSLALLTGKTPGKLHDLLKQPGAIPSPSMETVVGIPADAVRRRPDVRLSERRLAAQTARIGEAKAEMYPKFNLIGSIGLESQDSSKLFSSDSKAWSAGPNVSWPIFHAGSIRANVKVQTARQEQTLAQYEKSVLSAIKEVRDTVTAFSQEQQRQAALSAGAEAARKAVAISQDKYRNGLVDFNNVLDAQRSLFSFEDELISSRGAISSDLIRLYKALGGGWKSLQNP